MSPRKILLLLLLVLSIALVSHAQDGSAEVTLASWIDLDAPPGNEQLATDVVMQAMPGWKRDVLGNLILRKGSGSPRRVVACALDRPAFAVTEITDDGYLRLRELGALRQHSLWIQFHEGQRIKILTRSGPVPGVVTVKSTHLQRRVVGATVATLDDLWVDIGATSKADVQLLGVRMLDPVVRDVPAWFYGQHYISGQLASVRIGCAAVASAARGQVTRGETIFLLTTLRSFNHGGFESALRSLGRVDEVTLIDQVPDTSSNANAVAQRLVEKPAYLPESTGLTAVTVLSPRARFSGSLVETVQLADAEKLLETVIKVAGVSGASATDWLSLPASRTTSLAKQDSLSPTADLLKSLADVPSVAGHEREVRAAITAALPPWARPLARTDNEGNLVVEVGPEADPVMFIAHQDEVGFEVTGVNADGTVSLRTRGGLYPSLWEGQPALMHLDNASQPTAGVFVPRDTATAKQPEALTAWFGIDGEVLKARNINGLSVTAFKKAVRLGSTRFTARALDDRAGSTALLLALRRMQPSTLKRKVIFAWSVREETGLEGARALARQYASKVKRVYSIDTFVSSDSPLETTRFANAPLGNGAVIRGLDNSAIAPPEELDRVLNIARAQAIPIQVGATNGGTDGSDFVRYGVLHVSLSWPGRYSHSPVEVLDLRDLQALEKLIYSIAIAP